MGTKKGYLAYLDDILIYSKTEKEHLQLLEKHSNAHSRPD